MYIYDTISETFVEFYYRHLNTASVLTTKRSPNYYYIHISHVETISARVETMRNHLTPYTSNFTSQIVFDLKLRVRVLRGLKNIGRLPYSKDLLPRTVK